MGGIILKKMLKSAAARTMPLLPGWSAFVRIVRTCCMVMETAFISFKTKDVSIVPGMAASRNTRENSGPKTMLKERLRQVVKPRDFAGQQGSKNQYTVRRVKDRLHQKILPAKGRLCRLIKFFIPCLSN